MKTCILKSLTVGAGVLCVCVTLLLVFRSAPPQKDSFQTLSSVSALELPQAAAQIVSQAPKAEQAKVAREVVEKVAALSKPGLTPFAVAAICRANPETAVAAASTAVAHVPNETLSIAQAALAAAPAQAEALRSAIPAIKDMSPSQLNLVAAPPTVGPPFTPLTGPTTEYNAGSGQVLGPNAQRNYSAP